MSLRVWLLPALAFHVGIGQGGMPDMAQMDDMMAKLSPEQREEMIQMMKMNAAAEHMGGDDTDPGGPLPPPKPMTLKKARSMMKELRAALTAASARATFAAVEGEGNELAERRGPLVDQIAQSVFEKYGFEAGPQAGLGEAVRAAMASGDGNGQHDRKIRTAMEDIEEAITGKPVRQRLGRLPALDALAARFLDMGAPARAAALEEVRGTAGGEVYAEIMANVLERGDGAVVDEVVELADRASLELSSEKEIQTDVAVRMNVLREFVRPADHKIIQERLRALEEKTKKAARGGAKQKRRRRKARANGRAAEL